VTFALAYLWHLSEFLWVIFSDGRLTDGPIALHMADVAARPLIGPLLMQLFYVTERDRLPRHWLWKATIRITFAIAVPLAVAWPLCTATLSTFPWVPGVKQVIHTVSDALLSAGAIYTAIVIRLARRPDDSVFRRRRRRWYLALVVLELGSLCLQFVWWGIVQESILAYLPTMLFVLVTVYYGERLTFFDLFAKRGLLFFLALVVLTSYFALVSPHLVFRRMAFVTPWMTALTLMPLAIAIPWIYARLSAWIDRAWLGRRFSPVTAAANFAESVHGAISERDLLERAQASLSYIFQSKACIERGDAPAEPGGLSAGMAWGTVRILPRADEVPFLSEDAELLKMLAHTLGSVLESQSLRGEKTRQQQREQQLALNATQSELKALRAQINPHFLFNALNTITALIPRRPGQAEQTVEQLAEVFRYTVRRSENEWVRLDEEMDFVRSYLDIEKARFGERLQLRIEVEERVAETRIPAMIIQTLAENAIKHGIASVRGPGRINITAGLDGNKVRVTVEDNGLGFDNRVTADSLPEPSGSGGYGLKNVQERLRAHYGPGAGLRFERDAAAATTVVYFEVPVPADCRENA
jgi:two-component sensor histidine kinase